MAKVAQYITIVDKSNKVIGTSKHFKDLWREAKSSYQDRKAEIKAQRKAKEDAELRKAVRACSIADETERGHHRPSTSRRESDQRRERQHGHRTPPSAYHEPRPPAQRTHSNASIHSTTERPRAAPHMSLGEFNDQLYRPDPQHSPPTPQNEYLPQQFGLARARTDLALLESHRRPTHQLTHSRSLDDIDMDLAYGEFHPESLAQEPQAQEKELKSLVERCKGLLEQADCASHSARAMIGHLQKNPEALAAVGLTLAEISNIAGKMAPGALAAFSKTAPAVLALLASPEFLVAVGVGVGITVVAIGGYKIVKKIKEKMGDDGAKTPVDGPPEEALDVRELDRIENWRRGIADAQLRGLEDETGSVISGTSVEGELITPYAQRSMGHLPLRKERSRKENGSSTDKEKKKKHRRKRGDGDDETVVSRSSTGSTRRGGSRDKEEKILVKVKKPSPLSRMFSSRDSNTPKVRDFA